MIASSDLVSLVRKRLASPGRRRWPREGLDVARAWRGRGNVAWKGKRCAAGKMLRGRESVAWKGKRCVEGKALRGRASAVRLTPVGRVAQRVLRERSSRTTTETLASGAGRSRGSETQISWVSSSEPLGRQRLLLPKPSRSAGRTHPTQGRRMSTVPLRGRGRV